MELFGQLRFSLKSVKSVLTTVAPPVEPMREFAMLMDWIPWIGEIMHEIRGSILRPQLIEFALE